MTFLNKMERKFGRFAIRNLTMYMILTYVVGLLLTYTKPSVLELLALEPYFILKGEVWRVISWSFAPRVTLDVWTMVMLFCYYSFGRQLERIWGDFRYNLYVFGGILLTIIAAFALYFILDFQDPFMYFNGWFDTQYICWSLFFGYAMTCPDQSVLLYFIISLKAKWVALILSVFVVIDLVTGNIFSRAEAIAAIVNFLIFFGVTRRFKEVRLRNVQRSFPQKSKFGRPIADTKIVNSNVPKHKCAVCGKTEQDGEDLEFRYCSKCDGDYEYCQEHLFTHNHVKKNRGE